MLLSCLSLPGEDPTWQASALVGGVTLLDAGTPVVARRRAAGQVGGLAVHARVLLGAVAVVGAHLVDAHAPILAGGGTQDALIHVLLAGLAREERGAGADVMGFKWGALATIGAGVRGTWVCLLTLFA